MNTDPLITKISFSGLVRDIGAEACRKLPPGKRHRYTMSVTYHIEGKPDQEGTMRGKTRKGLQEHLVEYSDFASKGKLRAWYDSESGRFFGTSLTL